jgi:hypothetical protein
MAKQNPSVGHSDNGCGPPCKGSFYQERRVDLLKLAVGKQMVILKHPCCNCNTGCRRVTLWHPRPQGILAADGWVVKAIARVRWGDGCGGPEAEVDWKHGVILDLSGCYDEVTLELVEVSGTIPNESRFLDFGVLSACCGAGAARGCATRTTARIELEAAGGFLIPIPPFAYAVQFVPLDPTTFFVATTILVQSGSGSVNPDAYLTAASGDNVADPWALVNGAESIIVSNTGLVELNFEVVFLIGV